jgi:hypothetical protein
MPDDAETGEGTVGTDTHVSSSDAGSDNGAPSPPPKGADAPLSELRQWKDELQREIEKLRAEDIKEKEALKSDLAQARAWIEEQRHAQEERDRVKGDTTTMVVPPQEVASGLHRQEDKPADEHSAEHQEKRSKWKGLW